MKILQNNLSIAFCITLAFFLIFSWNYRWAKGPNQYKNNGNITQYYKKDRWTEQNWKVVYGIDEYQREFYGKQTPVPEDNHAWLLRNTLTASWCVVTFLSFLFSIYGLLRRMQQNK